MKNVTVVCYGLLGTTFLRYLYLYMQRLRSLVWYGWLKAKGIRSNLREFFSFVFGFTFGCVHIFSHSFVGRDPRVRRRLWGWELLLAGDTLVCFVSWRK